MPRRGRRGRGCLRNDLPAHLMLWQPYQNGGYCDSSHSSYLGYGWEESYRMRGLRQPLIRNPYFRLRNCRIFGDPSPCNVDFDYGMGQYGFCGTRRRERDYLLPMLPGRERPTDPAWAGPPLSQRLRLSPEEIYAGIHVRGS